MGDLFRLMRHEVDANARRAVEMYRREVPQYRSAMADRVSELSVIDFAMYIRRCSVERASAAAPLSRQDLEMIASTGRQRGEQDLSLDAQNHALTLHATLMLREAHEVATPAHAKDLLQFVGWLGQEGLRARAAYLHGYFTGVARSGSAVARIRLLATMLSTDEPVELGTTEQLDLRLAGRYLVIALRVQGSPGLPEHVQEKIIESLLPRWSIPMDWGAPNEFIVLAPADDIGDRRHGVDPAERRALEVIRDVTTAIGRPCAAGAALGDVGALAESLALARRISEVSPPETEPTTLNTVTDMFVELCVAQDQWADEWLRRLAERMKDGPDLIRTLQAYYRSDMNRVDAAATLMIHPRTLDYRLKRVQEVTGVRPSSTRGVRLLTTAVARARAGGWT